MSSGDEVDTFEATGAGASNTIPTQAGNLKKGGFVMIKDRPCKVMEVSTSKTGKHGHAKANYVGIDIFTGRKYEDVAPTSHNVEVPIVKRIEFSLLDIGADGFVSLLTEDGDTKNDLRMPEGELGDLIRADFDAGKDVMVSVQSACDEEAIVSYKCTQASS
nr:translation initiation factor 5A [Andalucia godoyi]|eukprot:ANDGO_02677.mRNA.1 Eukaryotic translation initiation factor 5A-1